MNLLAQARQLRRDMTLPERRLWARLRGRALGVKFRRQVILGPYIADFVCYEKRLVVEVDGSQHATSASDSLRDAFLNERGYRVLRFWNHDVLSNLEGVIDEIAEAAFR